MIFLKRSQNNKIEISKTEQLKNILHITKQYKIYELK